MTSSEEPVKMQGPQYSDKSFLYTWVAGVGLPFVQSVVMAFALMMLTAVVIFLNDGLEYLKPMVAVGAFTFVLTWVYLQRRWLTITRLEQMLNLDLNNDNKIGQKPITPKVHVTVNEVTQQGHIRSAMMFDMPCTSEQLQALAIGHLDDRRSLAEEEWTPLKAGKEFSIDTFRAVKAEMRKRGLIVQANINNNRAGDVLTTVGRRVMEQWKQMDIQEEDE